MTKTISFSECEHDGDLGNYEDDLQNSGAKIISSTCDSESETGEVTIEVADYEDFKKKFKETDSAGFSSIRF